MRCCRGTRASLQSGAGDIWSLKSFSPSDSSSAHLNLNSPNLFSILISNFDKVSVSVSSSFKSEMIYRLRDSRSLPSIGEVSEPSPLSDSTSSMFSFLFGLLTLKWSSNMGRDSGGLQHAAETMSLSHFSSKRDVASETSPSFWEIWLSWISLLILSFLIYHTTAYPSKSSSRNSILIIILLKEQRWSRAPSIAYRLYPSALSCLSAQGHRTSTSRNAPNLYWSLPM